MDEEEAHRLHTQLKQYDTAARQKQGLGFSGGRSPPPKQEGLQKKGLIRFRRAGDPPKTDPPASDRKHSRTELDGPSSPTRSSGRKDSKEDDRKYRNRGDLSSAHKGRSRERHGSYSAAHRHHSDRRSRDWRRKRSRSRSHSRHRSRSRSKSRPRSRSRSKHRTRSRYRSMSNSRSRSGSRRRKSHSQRQSRDRSRDERSRKRRRRSSSRRRVPETAVVGPSWSNLPSREEVDYDKAIPGFSRMTAAEKLKAKAGYIQSRYGATENHTSLAMHHASRLGESTLPADVTQDEVAEEAPVIMHSKMLDDSKNAEKAHEDAMFGVPVMKTEETRDAANGTGGGNNKDTEDNVEGAQAGGLISTEVMMSQKTTSWRERAAWMKRRRTGGT